VDAQGLVEIGDEDGGQLPYSSADPLDCHRADLLGLCLGIMGQPGLVRWQQDLERVDARDIRGYRHHCDCCWLIRLLLRRVSPTRLAARLPPCPVCAFCQARVRVCQ
jgi:hypothetical protein